MNKEIIFKKLNELNLDRNKIIIISGASLVVQNIIVSTEDIDLTCDKSYYDNVDWETKLGAFGKQIKFYDIFEISDNLYFPNDCIFINGYYFLNLRKCLEIKQMLNREKDKKVIQRLKKIIK